MLLPSALITVWMVVIAFGPAHLSILLQALMAYYDVDGDGNITYEEFLRGLR